MNGKQKTALILNIIIFIFMVVGTIMTFAEIKFVDVTIHEHGLKVLKFFTVQSNLFGGIVSLIYVIYLLRQSKTGKPIPHALNVIKFIATIDLVMGYADFLTPAIGSFIATCLCLERRKYSHGRKWKKTLPTTVIKLPIQRDSNGNPVIDDNRTYSDNGYVPDWQYMEDYINSLPYSDRI